MKQCDQYPMAWNEPGKGNDRNGNGSNQNPWGRKQDQGPPDLDKIIRDFIARIKQWGRMTPDFGKKKPPFFK